MEEGIYAVRFGTDAIKLGVTGSLSQRLVNLREDRGTADCAARASWDWGC